MFCKNCGIEIEEGLSVCPNCGESVGTDDNGTVDTAEKMSEDKNETKDEEYEPPRQDAVSNDAGNAGNYDGYGNFSDIGNAGKAERFVKILFLGVICIVIIGVICISAISVYNNSPEKIFDKVKESDSYKKYILDKNYSVNNYYISDIIDGKKDLFFEVNDEEGIFSKQIYIAKKDEDSGEYKIGMFSGMGGDFVESIEMAASGEDSVADRELFVRIKSVSEVSDEYINMFKSKNGIEDDKTAKELFESMYGAGIGFEQAAVFKISDYTFVKYGGSSAEDNGCDFIYMLIPEKVLIKSMDSDKDAFSYSYIDIADENNSSGDISEEDFNKNIEDFKSGKETYEIFSVTEDESVPEKQETSDETAETEN